MHGVPTPGSQVDEVRAKAGILSWNRAADVRGEMICASKLLLICHANVRWPVPTEVTATDATPTAGGAVRAEMPLELAEAPYKGTAYRGAHVRLDNNKWIASLCRAIPAPSRC